MRKIKTQGELEKKNKRNIAIMSILMLFLLVVSSIGFAFISGPGLGSNEQDVQNQEDISPYDKISFQYQGVNINLLSSYKDIENISVDNSVSTAPYLGNILYVDAKNIGILQEISSTLGRFSSRVQEVCYGNCKENWPEKNCTENLIVWKESSENKVYKEENCVFIEGDIRAADAFIYKLFKN